MDRKMVEAFLEGAFSVEEGEIPFYGGHRFPLPLLSVVSPNREEETLLEPPEGYVDPRTLPTQEGDGTSRRERVRHMHYQISYPVRTVSTLSPLQAIQLIHGVELTCPDLPTNGIPHFSSFIPNRDYQVRLTYPLNVTVGVIIPAYTYYSRGDHEYKRSALGWLLWSISRVYVHIYTQMDDRIWWQDLADLYFEQIELLDDVVDVRISG